MLFSQSEIIWHFEFLILSCVVEVKIMSHEGIGF
jgi:hypothetical protein